MITRRGTTASFERCVTAYLLRLNLFGLLGIFAEFLRLKAECICAPPSFLYCGDVFAKRHNNDGEYDRYGGLTRQEYGVLFSASRPFFSLSAVFSNISAF